MQQKPLHQHPILATLITNANMSQLSKTFSGYNAQETEDALEFTKTDLENLRTSNKTQHKNLCRKAISFALSSQSRSQLKQSTSPKQGLYMMPSRSIIRFIAQLSFKNLVTVLLLCVVCFAVVQFRRGCRGLHIGGESGGLANGVAMHMEEIDAKLLGIANGEDDELPRLLVVEQLQLQQPEVEARVKKSVMVPSNSDSGLKIAASSVELTPLPPTPPQQHEQQPLVLAGHPPPQAGEPKPAEATTVIHTQAPPPPPPTTTTTQTTEATIPATAMTTRFQVAHSIPKSGTSLTTQTTNKPRMITEVIKPGVCVGWRQTSNCDANGKREPRRDLGCNECVPVAASGYCECIHRKFVFRSKCGHDPITCQVACERAFLGADVSVPDRCLSL